MNKDDYLFYLRKALKGELPPDRVKYYVEYYKKYIEDEVRNGRKQKDVIEELGHPNMIAKSVIEAERMSGEASGHYEQVEEQEKSYKIDSILVWIILILAAIVVLSLAVGLFLPVMLIIGLVTIIKKVLE